MTNLRLLSTLILFIFFQSINVFACGYNFVSSCNTILTLEADGNPITFHADNCGYLTNFEGHNFGGIGSLVLTYGEAVTWESCDNDVLSSRIYYRIYASGNSPGSFTTYELNNLNIISTGVYTTKKHTNTASIDLGGTLNQGSYILEVYFEADIDENLDGVIDATIQKNNNDSNYKAFFIFTNGGTGDLNVNFTNKQNVSCNGGNDGQVTATTSNGQSPFSYSWSNNTINAAASNLNADSYLVVVTDANGLTGSANVIITEPSQLFPNAESTDANSSSSMNGTATANPSGGTPPYSYAWSNGENTQTITNLDTGSYIVSVTDANNCMETESVLVSIDTGAPLVYCSASSDFPWVDYISSVQLEEIDHSSQKATYNDFTTEFAELEQGGSYPIDLEADFSWTTYDEYFRVWIDFNRDGTFQEPDEIVFSQMLPAPAGFGQSGNVSGNITVPANAELGLTRMRVIMTRSGYANPCGSVANGEVEDYSINIMEGTGNPTCSISTTTSVSNCDDAGTDSDPSDDTFTFDLSATAVNGGSSWTATIDGQNESGNYGANQTFGSYLISNGNLNFTIEDTGDPSCNENIIITPPATCSNVIPCSIDGSISNIVCDDAGTGANSNDDTYTFDLLVTGVSTGSGWTANIDGQIVSGNYDVSVNIGPFLITNGVQNFTIIDNDSGSCTSLESVTPPSPCSTPPLCSISLSTSNLQCDDAGTDSNPNDDTFTFDLIVSGTNAGANGWTATINGSPVSGSYDTPLSLGSYLIFDGNLSFTVQDVDNFSCTESISVVPPPTCSNAVPCSIDGAISNIICDDAGTDSDSNDDTYTFDLLVTGTSTGSGWTATINGTLVSGNYSITQNIGPFLISDGIQNFTIIDNSSGSCTTSKSVTPPATCSTPPPPCNLSSNVTNISCDDAGTNSDSSDDTFSFDLLITGINTGANGWTTTINGSTVSGDYDVAQNLGGYLIADGDLDFTVVDIDGNSCATVVSVTAPPTCSNPEPCTISATASIGVCNDNGTPNDDTDDIYDFDITVTGNNTGSGWTADFSGGIFNGNYGELANIGDFLIANGGVTGFIQDTNDGTCTTTITVSAPSTCSNPTGPANYCGSSSAFPWHDWIGGVLVNDLDKTSGKSPYSNFTGDVANLVIGQSAPVELTASFSWFTYEEHWKVWIDYNQNGIFEEPSELAFSATQATPPNGTLAEITAGSITVPMTASLGTTRMRVAMKRDADPEPCETLPYGEVEDYTVNITSTVAQFVANSTLDLQTMSNFESVDLFWLVEDDDKISTMTIEKSIDGIDFQPIAAIPFENGQNIFNAKDDAPTDGNNFYRVKINCSSGGIRYSNIENNQFEYVLDYEIFPNPATNSTLLKLEKFIDKKVEISIHNQFGMPLFEQTISKLAHPILELDLTNFREGSYFVWIKVDGYRAKAKKLFVTKF